MKRIVSIAMAAAVAITFSACGGAAGTAASSAASTAAETGSADNTNTEEIVIGCLQDITGSTSALGISVQTVKNQMMIALRKLREEMKDYLPLLVFLFGLSCQP